jgi:hypothetical protein
MAWGRGGGRRAFSAYYPEGAAAAPPVAIGPEEERTFIEGTIAALKSRIQAMEKRLSELSENK